MKLPLTELRNIGDMTGWLTSNVINEHLKWILHGKTSALGLSPHQQGGGGHVEHQSDLPCRESVIDIQLIRA
jgi:hypothetical protein